MDNVVQLEDLRAARTKANKIKSLKRSIKDYEEIMKIKKTYLNSLFKFDRYDSMDTECERVYSNLRNLELQLIKLNDTLKKLSQG